MCTWPCQTAQCVKAGTPVMLTGSDSPRPDQKALAHCTDSPSRPKAPVLGGSATASVTQRGSSGPAVKETVCEKRPPQ